MDAITSGRVTYRILMVSLIAVTVGSLASVAAIGFVDAVHWLNDRLLISPYARIQAEEQHWLVVGATILVPALGGLVVGLMVRFLIRERRALGPPDTILAVQTRQRAPDLRSGLASTGAALVSLGSGASVGQYGPMVYLGSLFGSVVGRLQLRIPHQRSIAIGCGVAAAISTAFNAPIAGLVFAHEVILRHYSLRAFAPVTVAAATGYIIANVFLDRAPLFRVHFEGVAHSYEFLFFALEGLACAALAWLFLHLLRLGNACSERMPGPAWVRPAVAGLVLGLVALEVPEILGIGQETLRFATIEGAFGMGELGLIVAAKLVLTALCISFGFVGGVFSPALLIGILFGAFYGLVLPELIPLPLSGIVVYAICGMMALASSVIGAPLTTILIVFELTRSYDLTIAAMVAVVFSNLVSYRVMGRSLFDRQLQARGFDLSLGRERAILRSHRIAPFVHRGCTRVPESARAGEVRDRLVENGRSEAMLTDEAGRFRGVVRLQDLLRADPSAPAASIRVPAPLIFDEGTSVWDSMEALKGFLGEAVPLVDSGGGLVGVVPEEAVIRAYLRIIHELRQEENEAA